MELILHGDYLALGSDVYVYCERRLRFAMFRFRDDVARISVHIRPEGEADGMMCRMLANTVDGRRIAIEQGGAHAYEAVDVATRLLAQALERETRGFTRDGLAPDDRGGAPPSA